MRCPWVAHGFASGGGRIGGVRGSIRQRSAGSFEVRVYMGRDLLTGKERYASRTVRGGKREAQRVMREMVIAAEAGKHGKVDTTVGHLLEEWFEHARLDFSPSTARETRGYLDRTLLPRLGHMPLDRLGAAELDRFYWQLRTDGGTAGAPSAPATIRRIQGIIHRALGQAVRWGWLTANPANDASPPPRPGPSRRRHRASWTSWSAWLEATTLTWQRSWSSPPAPDAASWLPSAGPTSTSIGV